MVNPERRSENGNYILLTMESVKTRHLRRIAPEVQSEYLRQFVNAGGDEGLRKLADIVRNKEIKRLREEGKFPKEDEIRREAERLIQGKKTR